jgi:4-hydroxy-tetrahydrodipicolinate synthase
MNRERYAECYTALATPMKKVKGLNHLTPVVDYSGLGKLIEFQNRYGTKGILFVGTTGESPTLSWEEHITIIEEGSHLNKKLTIAGVGSNNTEETLISMNQLHGSSAKIDSILLVDPYYNGPDSLQIREEYVRPLAERFSEYQIIPYIIPGRTGTKLASEDLAILHHELKNVNIVKEATGDLENMRLTRKLCGDDFDILSGDDDMTLKMILDPEILAQGVISVASNVVPRAVSEMCNYALNGQEEKAKELENALKPLLQLVTVKTEEEVICDKKSIGKRTIKARNPVPYKTLMNILGMPAGPCRRPLGRMTKAGFNKVMDATRTVFDNNPEILEPVEEFFDVDLNERLYNEKLWHDLIYE